MNEGRGNNRFLYQAVLVFSLMCSYGWPGSFESLMGNTLVTLVEYIPFLLHIAIMLASSGESFYDIKIINLQKRYFFIYLLLAVFFVTSMLVTNYPKPQLISCVRFTVTAFYALWTLENFSVEEILEMACYAQMIFLGFTVLHLVMFPQTSFSIENGERSCIGLFGTKNPCGTQLSFGVALQCALFKIKRYGQKQIPVWFAPCLVVQSILLLMCRATGALFCGLLPCLYMLLLEDRDHPRRRLPLGYIFVVGSVSFLVVALTVLPLFAPFLEAIGKDATLTGRTPMWEQFITVMMAHNTLTGFGFCMFWKDPSAYGLWHALFPKDSWGNTMTFGAHNMLFEIWLDDGLIGLAALFLMILACMRSLKRISESSYLLCCFYMVWFTLKGLTERTLIPFNYQTFFLFLCMGAGCHPLPRGDRRIREG